jgi:hypothetical protein
MENKLLAAVREAAVGKVAEIAQIPPVSRDLFCRGLVLRILAFREVGPDWQQPQRYAWAGQAAALRDSITSQSLDADERSLIVALVTHGQRGLGSSLHFETFLGALEALAAQAQAKRGRGRPRVPPPFQPGALAAQNFVVALDRLVADCGGKRLTLFRYGGKLRGTLPRALILVTPHLGKGFSWYWAYARLKRIRAEK